MDALDIEDVVGLLTRYRCDVLLNATDPRFVMPLFRAALQGKCHYLDMAMSLSHPHPTDPFNTPGVMLGDEQFAMAAQWEAADRIALVGMGVEPGLSDVFAKYASDHLFSQIDEIGVRDGGNLQVDGYDFAPTFSIWTTIEECLNPPIVYERGRGHFTTAPFSEPEVFDFPEGIGPVECVNVEHEEVLLIPRWLDAGRVTFKYGLGQEFIEMLKLQRKLGIDSAVSLQVGSVMVSPRDVIAALLPDPGDVGRQDARQDLRREPGSRAWTRTGIRARSTCTTWSTTSGRCGSTTRRPSSGRPPSVRSWQWNSSLAGRGPVRESSGRRRSTRCPS